MGAWRDFSVDNSACCSYRKLTQVGWLPLGHWMSSSGLCWYWLPWAHNHTFQYAHIKNGYFNSIFLSFFFVRCCVTEFVMLDLVCVVWVYEALFQSRNFFKEGYVFSHLFCDSFMSISFCLKISVLAFSPHVLSLLGGVYILSQNSVCGYPGENSTLTSTCTT